MASEQMVHMSQGQGKTSYARNSSFQKAQQNRMKSLIEALIADICGGSSTLLHEKIQDLEFCPAPSKAMASEQMVHMSQGQGKTSYARNSSFQKAEQNRMKSLIEALITDICGGSSTLLHEKIQDLEFCPAPSKAMASEQMVHMSQGQGETSYARNSSFQKAEQNRMKSLIEAVIADICSGSSTLLHEKVVIADLGCSSGPNALALVSTATNAIHSQYLHLQKPPPEVCVLLNDLPDNDFNTVVKSLVTLRQSKNPVVLTGVVPGSFYERLFTSDSLHLVCASNSLQWLSKAPEDLMRNHIPAFDTDEHVRRERLPMVREAYAHQFRKDFTLFLELRAKELVSGGRMVISLVGTRSDVIVSKFFLFPGIIAQILTVMVAEGVIDKAKFDSFYVPVHGPSSEEVREIIEEEGSFSIREMRVHDPTTEMNAALSTPRKFVNNLRALFEPIIVQHFGDIMDEFVRTAELHWSLDPDGSLQEERARTSRAMLVVSLAKVS